ncbi:MAG: hypothetical protein K2Y37_11750 [Pirellulales bacterium]|nr:hypothetical protein [Pirellulales bacterium]
MLVATYSLLAALALGAPSADETFVESLRAMRLYRLAEVHCEQSIQRANLPAERQATLLVEWSRTLAASAREAPSTEAEPLWQRASGVIADFCQRNPQHPRLALLEAQGALLKIDRALWLADDVELLARSDERVLAARTELAADARRLAEVQDAVERAGRKAPASALRDPAPLTAPELQNLGKRLRFERARAYLRLAQISAEGSPDRADAFSQAKQLLEPLADLPVEHPLAWPARVAQVSCLRGTGDRAGAQQRLTTLEKADPPPEVTRQLRAERARLLALEGRFDEALALLKPPDAQATMNDPAADELRLELSLAARRTAQHDAAQVLAWQDRIKALASAIEQTHGPYWSRRADRLLTELNLPADNAPPLDAELLARTAATHWRDGRADEALVAYDRAAAAAIAADLPERAFDLAFLAATIEHSRQHWDAAAARYQALAERWPDHVRAAVAHLLSAHDRLQAIQANSPDDAGALGPYIELLLAHLERWPDATSAAEAHWRLGRAYESQSQFREAVDQFRAIPLSSRRATEAIEAASCGYHRLIAEQQAVAAAQRVAREAGEFFDSLLQALRDKPLTNSQRQAEIVRAVRMASARAWLACPPEGYRRAVQSLEPLVSERAAPGASWQPAAQALFITALVGDGRIAQARQLLGELSGLTPSSAQVLLPALAEISGPAASNADHRQQLSELKLLVFEKLGSPITGATPQERRDLELLEARTLAEAGRADEAARRFATLRSAYPNDAQILEAQAESLSALPGNSSAAAALAAWRDVERVAKPGSSRWLRAKLELSRWHLRAGDRAQAAKIIDLTELLHPELGGAELKAQFAALRREIAAAPAASSR